MSGRAVAACAALVALIAMFSAARAQDPSINVEVSPNDNSVERRMIPQLVRELQAARAEALLLYTEYSARTGTDMKVFLDNISEYAGEAVRAAERRPAGDDTQHCQSAFEKKMKKIELDAYRAASFSGENHHKFLLGHMIVFRMHLNKTEEYIRKCERALYGCGASCENKPKVRRWKRLAVEELHRVQDDLQHSRRSCGDLAAHARRALRHFRKHIHVRTSEAVDDYHQCLDGRGRND